MKFSVFLLASGAFFAGEVKAQSVVQFTFGAPPHRDSLSVLHQNILSLPGITLVRLDVNSRQGYAEMSEGFIPDETEIKSTIANAGMVPGCFIQYERGVQERVLLDHRTCLTVQEAEEAK